MDEQRPQRPRGMPPFAVELNTWSLDELQVAVRRLEDLEQHPGWQELCRVLDAARQQELRTLIHSEIELTQAQYAHLTGKIRGMGLLTTALEAVRWKAAQMELAARKQHEAADSGGEMP